MTNLTLTLAVAGLAGIVSGVMALRRNLAALQIRENRGSGSGQGVFTFVVLIGSLMGIGSWLATGLMGYPVETPEGVGRAVGVPFFVAFFDFRGRDYLGPLTIVAVVANAVFWFLVPQIFLSLKWKWRK